MKTLSPALLNLAADLLDLAGEEFARRCSNDLRLPADLPMAEVEALALLTNRANFNDRPVAEWQTDQIATAEQMRENATDFVVMGALAFGLREMASKMREGNAT